MTSLEHLLRVLICDSSLASVSQMLVEKILCLRIGWMPVAESNVVKVNLFVYAIKVELFEEKQVVNGLTKC